ncbi:hypothetical protein QYR09_06450 [Cellulophaga lytica]|nr:hypothetical protein QYR09_06450 [Cellulophaga lytica]
MYKKIISIFFTLLFLAFLSAPTIITMVNDTIDISAFYSFSEEEDNCAKKYLSVDNFSETNVSYVLKRETQGYSDKKYPRPLINLVSPPPEFHVA